jgi:hypothetical protein
MKVEPQSHTQQDSGILILLNIHMNLGCILVFFLLYKDLKVENYLVSTL